MQQAYNPYLPSWEYIPDGEPYVFGDRVYVYGSHDRFGSNYFCANDYVCWSAPVDDLAVWRYEGVIYRKEQDPMNPDGKRALYAPDVTVGSDGRYYLFYAFDNLGIMGVAVCDTPAGKYEYYGVVHYPDGTPVGQNQGDIFQFDPGLLVDDDGKVYLYSGMGIGENCGAWFGGRKADGMYMMELEADMLTVKRGPERLLHTSDCQDAKHLHGFFEASSMRKINGKYYFIYSSCASHELCYMVSDRPDGGFVYGGTLVSNGDIGYHGRPYEQRLNHIANTHGSLCNIRGKWYIFYHRHTNHHAYSRQACAEAIELDENGRFHQVEMTSCGLNGRPLAGKGTYPAYIACNLFTVDHQGYNEKPYETDAITGVLQKNLANMDRRPWLTQDGGDREGGENQYITGWRNGGVIGYKYFDFTDAAEISLRVKGTGSGRFLVYTDLQKAPAAMLPVQPCEDYKTVSGPLRLQPGMHPLHLVYEGEGSWQLKEFELK